MNDFIKPKFISVSQLNFYIKSIMDGDNNLRYVFVTGEISNLTDHYASGHIYLSLKDEKAVIKAVMFSYSAKNLRFRPQNGMKIIARGRVSVYEPSGQYQLYIEDMQPDGIGALTIAFEQLKERLQKEGLFDNNHKKPIPEFPKVISVITSPTGAALQDIKNIIYRRWPYAEIQVTPVLVQGEGAAPMLTKAIEEVCANNKADVIIIGRGGGSMEDLWAFNDEDLARAVYNSHIPVISAVGHETDFTICDFVADMRAPTPSAAAELATPDREAQMDLVARQGQYLSALFDSMIQKRESELSAFADVLMRTDPRVEVTKRTEAFENLSKRFSLCSDRLISDELSNLEKLGQKLFMLDPVSILSRGYSVTTKGNQTVTSVSDTQKGDNIRIILSDGGVDAVVI